MSITYENDPLTADEIITAAKRLSDAELERVYTGIGQLRRRETGGTGRVLSPRETELLEKINAKPPIGGTPRYVELRRKQRNESLSEAERAELIELSDQLEAYQVTRLEWMLELAKLWGTNLSQLVDDLQIRPPLNV